jgi:hypothetical protein
MSSTGDRRREPGAMPTKTELKMQQWSGMHFIDGAAVPGKGQRRGGGEVRAAAGRASARNGQGDAIGSE